MLVVYSARPATASSPIGWLNFSLANWALRLAPNRHLHNQCTTLRSRRHRAPESCWRPLGIQFVDLLIIGEKRYISTTVGTGDKGWVVDAAAPASTSSSR